MGTWGCGTFENDSALDWLHQLVDGTDDGPIIEALAAVVDALDDTYIDVDDCAAALAAGEVVAMLGDHGSDAAPQDLEEWVALQPRPIADELIEKHVSRAVEAVDRIRRDSEMAELWAESDDEDAWLAAAERLRARLVTVSKRRVGT